MAQSHCHGQSPSDVANHFALRREFTLIHISNKRLSDTKHSKCLAIHLCLDLNGAITASGLLVWGENAYFIMSTQPQERINYHPNIYSMQRVNELH